MAINSLLWGENVRETKIALRIQQLKNPKSAMKKKMKEEPNKRKKRKQMFLKNVITVFKPLLSRHSGKMF